tara:strand:+ start:1007 stop:2113 length:1107 start_codon:yes stop_codon:yes gene_type:complete
MEVNQLATWLENNKHKFIFYSYPGGTGGEFVCDYISKHLDLYNAKALTFDNAYTRSESENAASGAKGGNKFKTFNTSVTNRYNFLDPLLYDAFTNGFRTGEEVILGVNPMIGDSTLVPNEEDTFTIIARKIIEYINSEGYNTLDESMLEDFNNQDKKYLIRFHRMLPYMKLFNTSKIYVIKADKWNAYVSLLVECKILLSPYYTYKEKVDALTNGHKSYKKDNIEDSMLYIKPLLDDDTVPLYEYTIQVMLNPSTFDVDISTLSITELQKMLFQFVYYRHLSNKYREDYKESTAYIKTYYSEWMDEFNINLVPFEEVFTGEWASNEFDLDKEDFYNSMVRWDQRNTIYLEKIGIKPKRGIKRLNQGLY